MAQDFEALDYNVISKDFLDFKIEYVLDYDVIINTYDCDPAICGCSVGHMKKCNVDLPLLLSEYCKARNKRYVQISTADLYHKVDVENDENDTVCANGPYLASKLLGEGSCDKKDIIIRTKNMFNHTCSKENALFNAIINTTPTKNIESYSWTVDVIRGIIALLRNKQHGVYNLASCGSTSQAQICEDLEIHNVVPMCDIESKRYINLGISKLTKHIVPMDIMDNIPKCFAKLKEELGE